MRSPRIALIHAVTVAMEPVAQALAVAWPEAEPVNLLDDALGPDRARDADVTPAIATRIRALADYAASLGADGILYTCSAFGGAIAAVAARLSLPVLTPNEAMFEDALGRGARIGMLATFGPSVAGMEAEFADAARAAGSDAKLETVLVAGALDALKAGDARTHARLLAAAAPRLAGCDAIMLAHFSTSRARPAVEGATDTPVLTAPECAVRALRARIEGPDGRMW